MRPPSPHSRGLAIAGLKAAGVTALRRVRLYGIVRQAGVRLDHLQHDAPFYLGRRAGDGLPIPPLRLRRLVVPAPQSYAENFISGRDLQSFLDILARNGVAIDRLEAVLDFGCG